MLRARRKLVLEKPPNKFRSNPRNLKKASAKLDRWFRSRRENPKQKQKGQPGAKDRFRKAKYSCRSAWRC